MVAALALPLGAFCPCRWAPSAPAAGRLLPLL